MKYSPYWYAKALAAAIADVKDKRGQDEIEKNFIALVRKNGDEARLRKIVEIAARLVRGKQGIRKVTIESARTLLPAQEKLLDSFLSPGDVVEREVDEELIAGIRIILNDELQFDGSLRGKLERIF